jgi:signal transduction histidine kinase
LVNDLLDLARMEAGETKLTIKSFNINELIRRCIIKLESIIEQKKLLVEANFEEEEMYVSADADAIERVVINLIHNAIKFTDENGVISLSTYSQKGKIYAAVQDTGIGIEEEELNMIWDRFYKSDKSRGKDKTGTGLGLAIIKNIISEHKQEIWVESKVGSGTKFIFTLDKGEESE